MKPTANSILFWRSRDTGYVGHGSLIPEKQAHDWARYTTNTENRVVTLSDDQLDQIQTRDDVRALDKFNPFHTPDMLLMIRITYMRAIVFTLGKNTPENTASEEACAPRRFCR